MPALCTRMSIGSPTRCAMTRPASSAVMSSCSAVPPIPFHRSCERVAGLRHVDAHDGRSVPGERRGDRRADPPRRTRDDGQATVQVCTGQCLGGGGLSVSRRDVQRLARYVGGLRGQEEPEGAHDARGVHRDAVRHDDAVGGGPAPHLMGERPHEAHRTVARRVEGRVRVRGTLRADVGIAGEHDHAGAADEPAQGSPDLQGNLREVGRLLRLVEEGEDGRQLLRGGFAADFEAVVQQDLCVGVRSGTGSQHEHGLAEVRAVTVTAQRDGAGQPERLDQCLERTVGEFGVAISHGFLRVVVSVRPRRSR